MKIAFILFFAMMLLAACGNEADKYYTLGTNASAKGLFAEAIENYTLAIAADTNLGKAYYLRGMTYHRTGFTNLAHIDLRKAADLGIEPARMSIRLLFQYDYFSPPSRPMPPTNR